MSWACYLKSSTFFFIILSLYPLCVGLFLKYLGNVGLLSSLVHFLCQCLWFVWLVSSFVYLKKEQPTFLGCRSGLSWWSSREHLLIISSKPIVWIPRFVIFRFVIFSWVVYWGYTRPRACLKSVQLLQMWPSTLWVSESQKINFLVNLLSLNLWKYQ